jgi:hypothetical protein
MTRDDFEALIDQILQARYPTAGIRKVDGSGGDKGIDSFGGTLKDELAVWQCKHFANGIKLPQRKQILKSLKTAFANHKPIEWTLCVPIDLKVNEHKWFEEEVVARYKGLAKISLMQASDIVGHLVHYKSIREAVFPDGLSEVAKLKEMATNTEQLGLQERGIFAEEVGNQYISALERKDGRFRYELAVGKERNPEDASSRPGLLASIFSGGRTLDIFARDVIALRDDPIRMLIKFSRDAGEKMEEMIKTGKGQSFQGSELRGFEISSSPLKDLLPRGMQDIRLEFIPKVPMGNKIFPIRLTLGVGEQSTTFDYVPFQVTEAGTEQLTLMSGGSLPFALILKISMKNDSSSEVAIESRVAGADVREIQRAIKAFRGFVSSGRLELFNLETQSTMFQFEAGDLGDVEEDVGFVQLIDDSVVVADFLGANMQLPLAAPTQDDFAALQVLKQMATGEDFRIKTLEMVIHKQTKMDTTVLQLMTKGQSHSMLFDTPPGERLKVLFGTPIQTGRLILQVDRVQVKSFAKTKALYLKAKEGERVPLSLICNSTARYLRAMPSTEHASEAA